MKAENLVHRLDPPLKRVFEISVFAHMIPRGSAQALFQIRDGQEVRGTSTARKFKTTATQDEFPSLLFTLKPACTDMTYTIGDISGLAICDFWVRKRKKRS